MRTPLVLMTVCLVCCTQPASRPYTAGDSDPKHCEPMCINLGSLDCPEAKAKGDGCVGTCVHVQETGITDLRPGCVASARTAVEVRKCGPGVHCRGR